MICRYLYQLTLSQAAYERGCFTPSTTLNTFRLSSVQFSQSVMSHSLWPHEPQHARPPCPSPTPGVYPTHVHWVSDAIQLSHALPSPSPPTFSLSQHQGFSNESALRIRWPKYWSFSFNISPSNEHPGLISFRMDWSDLLEIQGTLKSLLQHHTSKASILPVLSFLYTPTLTSIYGHWKNHSLD